MGDEQSEPRAAESLLPEVYDELRRLAGVRMGAEAGARTLQATALVHEAYLRVVRGGDPGWRGPGHFFGAAARAMRRILVEQARARARLKRGGDRERLTIEAHQPALEDSAHDVLVVEEVLARLEQQDPRKARLVELRYHAGLTNQEAAVALGLSVPTVEREWRFVRSWMQAELAREEENGRR